MKDYFGNDVKVGDTILMCNRSLLEAHVVISIPLHENSITVSTLRVRSESYSNRIVWSNYWYNPIIKHNGKINKWVDSRRIIRTGEFDGDIRQFKTINQLEHEWKSQNSQN
jgi:hypothetical protein